MTAAHAALIAALLAYIAIQGSGLVALWRESPDLLSRVLVVLIGVVAAMAGVILTLLVALALHMLSNAAPT